MDSLPSSEMCPKLSPKEKEQLWTEEKSNPQYACKTTHACNLHIVGRKDKKIITAPSLALSCIPG